MTMIGLKSRVNVPTPIEREGEPGEGKVKTSIPIVKHGDCHFRVN